jgi:hypothetical protein
MQKLHIPILAIPGALQAPSGPPRVWSPLGGADGGLSEVMISKATLESEHKIAIRANRKFNRGPP